MKKLFIVGACLLPLLGGCASVASFVASSATSLSSATPSQVTTLAEAVQAADLVTKGVDVYITSGAPITKGQLQQVQIMNNVLHGALGDLLAANAAGKSLDYAAFNAALNAYQAYATTVGISH